MAKVLSFVSFPACPLERSERKFILTRMTKSVYDTMTSPPSAGNATPVFILDRLDGWIPDIAMQLIARELNHAETVFVRRRAAAPDHYDARFFTPYAEEPFCGHGILGAAHALHLATGLTRFDFSTRGGIAIAASVATRSQTWANGEEPVAVSMRFPASPADRTAALGIEESEIVRVGMNDLRDLIVELSADVDCSAAKMEFDPVALPGASPPSTRSQVITSESVKSVDGRIRVPESGQLRSDAVARL
jgi:PhzF family phenazine biosynthesis protein